MKVVCICAESSKYTEQSLSDLIEGKVYEVERFKIKKGKVFFGIGNGVLYIAERFINLDDAIAKIIMNDKFIQNKKEKAIKIINNGYMDIAE